MSTLTPLRTAFFAFVVGIFVFNVFACQVLVAPIAHGIGLSPSQASLVPTLTALGYALGLIFLVPLADVVENRRLVTLLGIGCSAALLLAALVQQVVVFLAMCLAIGATASLVQILVPLVGSLTPPAERGRTLGNVMSGVMLGIMLSRPIGSLVGAQLGWRAVYALSALVVALVLVPLRAALPVRAPATAIHYREAVGSLVTLVRREPVTRTNAITAALVMGAFNLFWTAITSQLTSGFGLSARGIALFGIVGTAGAVSAPLMGRLGDRGWTRIAAIVADIAVIGALLLALVSGGALATTSPTLGIAGLVAAAILLDFGVVGDQTLGRRAINLLDPAAIGRRNGIFVGIFFLGGAAGSALAGPMSAAFGWTGLCLTGAAFGAAALTVSLLAPRIAGTRLRKQQPRVWDGNLQRPCEERA
ncbi:MAG TPA: MFS transporter [Kofleriaceae bacterium]|jgi:predicted MFS family arabinose efflux permease